MAVACDGISSIGRASDGSASEDSRMRVDSPDISGMPPAAATAASTAACTCPPSAIMVACADSGVATASAGGWTPGVEDLRRLAAELTGGGVGGQLGRDHVLDLDLLRAVGDHHRTPTGGQRHRGRGCR